MVNNVSQEEKKNKIAQLMTILLVYARKQINKSQSGENNG